MITLFPPSRKSRKVKASAAYTQQKFLGYVFTDKIKRNIRELPEELKERTIMLEKHAEKLVEMAKK